MLNFILAFEIFKKLLKYRSALILQMKIPVSCFHGDFFNLTNRFIAMVYGFLIISVCV